MGGGGDRCSSARNRYDYLGGAAGCGGTARTCQQARSSDSLAPGKGIEGQIGWEQERDKVHKSYSESTSLILDSATAI